MIKRLRTPIVIFFSLAFLLGIAYPLLLTGIAQSIFPRQANGSLITQNQRVIGSELIGQYFDQPQYFWGRLSATGDEPYNASSSGASNLSVMNPTLLKNVQQRITDLKSADPGNTLPIPADLVTASASGLDPHISPAAAKYQAGRVARIRGISIDQIMSLIDQFTENKQFGFLGEARVNVLELNLALDALK